jgi:ribosomal protein S21
MELLGYLTALHQRTVYERMTSMYDRKMAASVLHFVT